MITRIINYGPRNNAVLDGLQSKSPAILKYCNVTQGDIVGLRALYKFWLNKPDIEIRCKLP